MEEVRVVDCHITNTLKKWRISSDAITANRSAKYDLNSIKLTWNNMCPWPQPFRCHFPSTIFRFSQKIPLRLMMTNNEVQRCWYICAHDAIADRLICTNYLIRFACHRFWIFCGCHNRIICAVIIAHPTPTITHFFLTLRKTYNVLEQFLILLQFFEQTRWFLRLRRLVQTITWLVRMPQSNYLFFIFSLLLFTIWLEFFL